MRLLSNWKKAALFLVLAALAAEGRQSQIGSLLSAKLGYIGRV